MAAHVPSPALLPTMVAHLLAFSFSASYVTSLYAVGKFQSGARDEAHVIRSRLAAVTVVSTASCLVIHRLTSPAAPLWPWTAATLRALGFTLPQSVYPCLQTQLLFIGPLYAAFLDRILGSRQQVSGNWITWIGFRNYVWAPLTEEIVFRSCILAVYTMNGAADWKMITFAPLLFGLAHVHHGIDVFRRFGSTKTAFRRAALTTLFQTAYTTIFGAHASFLLLRSNSVLPPLTAHIFCNIMGVPELGAEVRRMPRYRLSIYAAYFLGIGLFTYTLRSWTTAL